MSGGKNVTPQTLVGEAGIALIHKRVTEMGYLFHPRRVDHGIDGHIDLVEPGTREVLNLVLLVQSKASGLPFPYETETSFQYTCNKPTSTTGSAETPRSSFLVAPGRGRGVGGSTSRRSLPTRGSADLGPEALGH